MAEVRRLLNIIGLTRPLTQELLFVVDAYSQDTSITASFGKISPPQSLVVASLQRVLWVTSSTRSLAPLTNLSKSSTQRLLVFKVNYTVKKYLLNLYFIILNQLIRF